MEAKLDQKETLLRRVVPLAIMVVGIALLTGLFFSITQRLNDLRTAPGDNLTWALSQVEVEVLLLSDETNLARQTQTSDLSTLRRRFDNLYSRASGMADSRAFAEMRENVEFDTQLTGLQARLDSLAGIIDLSDDELQQRLDDVFSELTEAREDAHDLALTGIALGSVSADAERTTFARVLYVTAAISVSVIMFLGFMLFSQLRQHRIHREAADAVKRANARLKASFDVSLDAIIVADERGTILDFSGAAETVFGFSKSDVIGAEMADLIIPEQYRAAHRAGMERFNRTKEPHLVGQGRIEITALRKSGEEFPVEISIGMASDHRGHIFISYLRDITERLAAEENLKTARDEALKAESAKSNFLAVMSHEMRTPLNGLFGSLELLQKTTLDAPQAGYLKIAKRSGDILLHHVNDVLDVSRMDADKLELVNSTFDLAQFFKDVVATNEAAAFAHGNRVTLQLVQMPDVPVMMDEQRLRQVAYNLLSNALKFTNGGTITVNAETRKTDAGGTELQFSVQDTGVGISGKDQSRVFERFFTQDRSYDRLASGAGLGLTICKQIVEMMGGEITLRSKLGQGSTFTVTVPMALAKAQADAAPETEGPFDASVLKGKHILLVEDNEINRLIVCEMLQSEGLQVSIARDGQEAIDQAQLQEYSAILMDVSMPVMNGIDATKAIRGTQNPNQNRPILALTAHALPEERTRFLEAGMNVCLSKPVSQNTLLRALVAVGKDPNNLDNNQRSNPGSELIDPEIFGGLIAVFSTDKLAKLIGDFDDEISKLITAIPVLTEAADLSDLAVAAHKSIGSAGMIGVLHFRDQLRALEQAAKAGQQQDAQAAAAVVVSGWANTRKALMLAIS